MVIVSIFVGDSDFFSSLSYAGVMLVSYKKYLVTVDQSFRLAFLTEVTPVTKLLKTSETTDLFCYGTEAILIPFSQFVWDSSDVAS